MCIIDNCSTEIYARGLCYSHYRKSMRAGTLDSVGLPKAPAHRLSEKDPVAQTALCEICGPTVTEMTKSGPACKARESHYKRGPRERFNKHGVSSSQKRALLEEQDFLCKLCAREISFQFSCVDHCHETGRVRGVLCRSCNLGLGHFGDTREGLLRVLAYLEGNS